MVANPVRGRAWLSSQANCVKCTLAEDGEALSPVLGWGPRDAELVVVGEAPGEHEQLLGKPFMGRSGNLLWHSLKQRGVGREAVYATNTLLCLPPKGPTVPALRCCAPRLEAELGLLEKRRVVLCVGTSAVTALRGKKSSVAALSGRVEWSEKWQCWLAFAYHPAAVLRNPNLYREFVWGVKEAVAALQRPLSAPDPADAPPIRYERARIENLYEVYAMLARAMEQPKIAVDVETTGLDPWQHSILALGLCWDPDWAYIIPAEVARYDINIHYGLRDLLTSDRTQFIYHNGKFDTSVLRQQWGIPARIDIDTMLLHFALDERTGGGSNPSPTYVGGKQGSAGAHERAGRGGSGFHDLKRVAMRFCGAPPWAEHIDGAHMADVPEAERNQYHAYDLVYTFRLERVLREALEEEARRHPSKHGWPTPLECHDRVVIPAANALRNMEHRGIRIDRERLVELKVDYAKQIEEARGVCARTAERGEDFNPASWMQVQKVLTDQGYGHPYTGSTDEAALHDLQRADTAAGRPPNRFLRDVLEYRSLIHTKSTYLDGIERRLERGPKDGRLRSSFLQHTATTGRLSAQDPNLQSITKDSVIREIFIPSEHHVFVEADYRRLEVGVLAWLSGDEALRRDFLADDFHWNTACRVFPEIVAEMERARRARDLVGLEVLCGKHAFFNDFAQRQARLSERVLDVELLYGMMKTRLRRQAKYISFGVMYGEGVESLANPETGMGVAVAIAAHYLTNWKVAYSVAISYMNSLVVRARTERWVESASGRRRRFAYPPWLARHLANEAMNMPIQATASDIMLVAMTRLEGTLPARGLGAPLLPVHDSTLFDIREDKLDPAERLIRETMETVVIDPEVPELVFGVDLARGRNWAKCK